MLLITLILWRSFIAGPKEAWIRGLIIRAATMSPSLGVKTPIKDLASTTSRRARLVDLFRGD